VLVLSPLSTRGAGPVRPGQRLRRADGLRRTAASRLRPGCDVALTEILAAGVQVVTLCPAAGVQVVTLRPAAGVQVTLGPAAVIQALARPAAVVQALACRAVFPPGVFPAGPVRDWHLVRHAPAGWSPPGRRVSDGGGGAPGDNILRGWRGCGFPAGVRCGRHFQGWRVSLPFPPARDGGAHLGPPEDLVTPDEASDDKHKQRQARHAN
jgi:hypothetical protein